MALLPLTINVCTPVTRYLTGQAISANAGHITIDDVALLAAQHVVVLSGQDAIAVSEITLAAFGGAEGGRFDQRAGRAFLRVDVSDPSRDRPACPDC